MTREECLKAVAHVMRLQYKNGVNMDTCTQNEEEEHERENMRGRKKHYVDIVLNEAKLKRLGEGYTVHTMVKGQLYAISKEVADPVTLKINALKQQIAELQSRIKPAKRKYNLTPELLQILRANAAKARAAKAMRRSNV